MSAAQKAALFGNGNAGPSSGPGMRGATASDASQQFQAPPEQPQAQALLELEHSIGYNARYNDTLKYHPTEKDTLIYPIGGLLVIENLHDKSKQ